MARCPANCTEAGIGKDKCGLLMAAYILAGLAMMLNIRISYSSVPYALIRFKLPENLFSVFVRRMASALELWCLPSMLLGNLMDLFQKLFDDGAELRAIKYEASDIKNKAGTLKTTAQQQATDAGEVSAAASSLTSNAQTLNEKATELPTATGGTLAGLSNLAEALAKASKGSGDSGDTSLYKTAEALKTATDPDKAIAVIDAFKNVKDKYNDLEKESKYSSNKPGRDEQASPDSAKGRVKAVEGAWEGVNTQFGALCRALIKEFAEQVESKATALPSDAQAFKTAYDNFEKIYNSMPDDQAAKSNVTSDWDKLKNVISGEMKRWKFYWIIVPSIVTQWFNFLTYVILLIIFFTVVIGLEKIPSQMPNKCSPRIYKIDYPCSTI